MYSSFWLLLHLVNAASMLQKQEEILEIQAFTYFFIQYYNFLVELETEYVRYTLRCC